MSNREWNPISTAPRIPSNTDAFLIDIRWYERGTLVYREHCGVDGNTDWVCYAWEKFIDGTEIAKPEYKAEWRFSFPGLLICRMQKLESELQNLKVEQQKMDIFIKGLNSQNVSEKECDGSTG